MGPLTMANVVWLDECFASDDKEIKAIMEPAHNHAIMHCNSNKGASAWGFVKKKGTKH
jgi:hypothetical protein